MATPTDILRLQLMPLAETDWHTKTEANLNRLEEAIASEANISTTGGTTTLTSEDYIADQTRRPILRVTGTLASNAIIQIPTPNSAKIYTVYNATSGSFTLTVRNGASGGTFVVPQGTAMVLLAIASGTALIPLTLAMGTTGLAEAPDGFTLAQILNRGQVDNRVLPLLSRTETTPPGGPSTDDAYYVPTSATGAWSGQDGKIARYNGSGWSFFDLPSEGMLAPIADEGTVLCTHSGALADFVGAGGIADGAVTAAKLATNSVTTTKIADANVTNAKLANMTANTLKGRSASTGVPQDLSASAARSLLNVADGATANSSDATLLARANHTGTQAISTVSGLQDALDAKVAKAPSVNAQTGTSYTLVIGDAGNIVTMSNSSANTLTIPANASVAFGTGTIINVLRLGTGVTTIQGATGVTVNGVSAGSGAMPNRYQGVSLTKIATNTWVASGDIETVA